MSRNKFDNGSESSPRRARSSGGAAQRSEGRSDSKLYYKLSDIASLLDVEKHVLKYWEEAFGIFKPVKVGRRLKLYTLDDLENFREVRRLVHGERYTVEGARMRLAERGLTPAPPPQKEREAGQDGSAPSGSGAKGSGSQGSGAKGAGSEVSLADGAEREAAARKAAKNLAKLEEASEALEDFDSSDLGGQDKSDSILSARLNWSEGLSDLLGPGGSPSAGLPPAMEILAAAGARAPESVDKPGESQAVGISALESVEEPEAAEAAGTSALESVEEPVAAGAAGTHAPESVGLSRESGAAGIGVHENVDEPREPEAARIFEGLDKSREIEAVAAPSNLLEIFGEVKKELLAIKSLMTRRAPGSEEN